MRGMAASQASTPDSTYEAVRDEVRLVQDSLLPLEQASRLLRKRLYRIDLFLLPATLLEFQEWL